MKQRGLGKGLGALLPDTQNDEESGVQEIRITQIDPNAAQPRQNFDDEKLVQLAQSIKTHGIVQPILLRPESDRYVIVAGERRWRAARLAGLKSIPAIIKDIKKKELMEIALIENLQREDLNPIEEAMAIKSLMEEYSLTQEEVSQRIGKSRSAIANTLRLLHLSDDIIQHIQTGQITPGHARALLAIEDPDMRRHIVKKIVEEGMSVRQAEMATQKENNKSSKKTKTRSNPHDFFELESTLADIFGARVRIQGGKKKGKIQIEYFDLEDLERIFDILSNKKE